MIDTTTSPCSHSRKSKVHTTMSTKNTTATATAKKSVKSVATKTTAVANIEKSNVTLSVDTMNDLIKFLNDNNINHGMTSTQPYVIGNMSSSFYVRSTKTKLIRVGVSRKMYGLNENLKSFVDSFVKSNASNSKVSTDSRNYILDLNDSQFLQYINACGQFIKTA